MARVAETRSPIIPAVAVGGIVLVLGIVLLVWPSVTTLVLVSLFGIGAVVHGALELSRVFAGEGDTLELWSGLVGIAGIFGGILVFVVPLVSTAAVATVIGLYWLLAGAVELASAYLGPGAGLERFLLGVLSLMGGALVLLLPPLSLVVLAWIAGGWLVVAGAIIIVASMPRTSSRGMTGGNAPT
jgi:uncharacterized membrane protein HdeD (DUF308 family)